MKMIKHMEVLNKKIFGREMYSGIITLNDALEDHKPEKIDKFKESTIPKIPYKKENKGLVCENAKLFPKGRPNFLHGFKSKIVPIGKQTQVKLIKLLNPKQML